MQLRSQGIRRMIMSTGHLADQIEETSALGARGKPKSSMHGNVSRLERPAL